MYGQRFSNLQRVIVALQVEELILPVLQGL